MKRTYLTQLLELLEFFPCVVILGPRQCGKTTLLSLLPEIQKWKHFDMEKAADFDMLSRDPDLFFKLNSKQRLTIDEAQRLPQLFEALRVTIDEQREVMGRFILTGSSSPDLVKKVSETLAGRVAIIDMSPLSYREVLEDKENQKELVFINKIFKNMGSDLPAVQDYLSSLTPSPFSLQEIFHFWWWGGYPEPWIKNNLRFRHLWMQNYVRNFLERDLKALFPKIDSQRYRLFLQTLSSLSGTIINYSDLARSLGLSAPTVRDYLSIAEGTFLWRNIPSYEKNASKRMIKHPKGFLRDSGLSHYLLGIYEEEQLLSHPKLGQLWESFVTEEILRALSGCSYNYFYYYFRTAAGAEIDLILEGDFGLIPVEIKFTQTVKTRDLTSLSHFIEEKKIPYGIVINNNDRPILYSEKIIGIPFRYLFTSVR